MHPPTSGFGLRASVSSWSLKSDAWSHWRISLSLCALILLAGCSGSGTTPTTTTTTSIPGTSAATITITSAGVSPKTVTVAPGSQVTFVNNDSKSHNMQSDPHPEHTDCPEIGQVGTLSPGQSRQTGNLNTVRTCGFHDHEDFANTGLWGSIVIR